MKSDSQYVEWCEKHSSKLGMVRLSKHRTRTSHKQPVSGGLRSVSQFAASSPILNPTTYLEALIRPTTPLT